MEFAAIFIVLCITFVILLFSSTGEPETRKENLRTPAYSVHSPQPQSERVTFRLTQNENIPSTISRITPKYKTPGLVTKVDDRLQRTATSRIQSPYNESKKVTVSNCNFFHAPTTTGNRKEDFKNRSIRLKSTISVATTEDRDFLESLDTRNNLDPDKVFVEQAGLPSLDLHYATTREAEYLVNYFLLQKKRQKVRVITGRGLHSADGRPTLKKKIEQMLNKKNLMFKIVAEGGAFDFQND